MTGFAAHHFSSSAGSEGVKPRARMNSIAKELAGLAVWQQWALFELLRRHMHVALPPQQYLHACISPSSPVLPWDHDHPLLHRCAR